MVDAGYDGDRKRNQYATSHLLTSIDSSRLAAFTLGRYQHFVKSQSQWQWGERTICAMGCVICWFRYLKQSLRFVGTLVIICHTCQHILCEAIHSGTAINLSGLYTCIIFAYFVNLTTTIDNSFIFWLVLFYELGVACPLPAVSKSTVYKIFTPSLALNIVKVFVVTI